ncbi:YciI family protein [Variovorax sp. LjRoot84]|uniref:YciI family protein n=1 Tax=Variovorax sp. LjRoot84 TaxID=3342340 RepID=UPI003ECEA7ED
MIHALDRPGALPVRLANYDAHKVYLAAMEGEGVKTLVSGPLVEDDGQTMKGSLFVVDVVDRAAAESFHTHDPFFTAGVWQEATITAYVKRVG